METRPSVRKGRRRRFIAAGVWLGALCLSLIWLGWLIVAPSPGVARPPATALAARGVRVDQTSVSGISSGAYMAGQFQLAHSRDIIGAGLVAGGPYGCAESLFSVLFPIWSTAVPHNFNRALNGCMKDRLKIMGIPKISRLVDRARSLASSGAIDPLAGLADDHVYLYWGGADETVAFSVVEAAEMFYRAAGVPSAHLHLIKGAHAAHAFITLDHGLACGIAGPPYINDCDYDQAGAILGMIYGHDEHDKPVPLKPRVAAPAGEFILFDQTGYSADLSRHGLAPQGVVYVPPACAAQPGCRVHIVFHGCQQGREFVGDRFIKESGYANWADTNRLVILFPQVEKTIFNPKGCWDWWGYTGLNYRQKSSPQIKAVWRMVQRLAEPSSTPRRKS